jgi:DNA-directed RNA polymerase II subunit RPB2
LIDCDCRHWFLGDDGSKAGYINERGSNGLNSFGMGIASVRFAGQEEVFDISVDETHTFVANGALVSNCIPSRMTVNQLMESVLGKTSAVNGTFGDATPFTSSSVNIASKLCDDLGMTKFNGEGTEMLYNGFSGETMGDVFMGPVYYQRLKHLVSEKIHARATGPVTTLTRQPLEGRSKDGGLRFGEMERDCMVSHGTSMFLKERLCDQSDPYQAPVCKSCGNISTTATKCGACGCDEVMMTGMPYVSKLLLQELNAMCIKTKIGII